MATATEFNGFAEDLLKGLHDFSSDAITVALCSSANAPTATDATLSDLTTIAYTNLSSRVVTISSVTTSTATGQVVAADLELSASGGDVATFRYVALYNDDTTGDRLIQFYDLGQDITILDGNSHTLNFDAATNVLVSVN